VTGEKLGALLDWWEGSERRRSARMRLQEADGTDPDRVIMSADVARANGLSSTVVFPQGNIAPEGSLIKATSIDPSVIGDDNVYRHRGPARVFVSERDAIAAIKGTDGHSIEPNDVIVLIGAGPLGTGMEETYQLTSALKFIPWGKTVALVTDGRFSGVSTGACIGHVGPEALAGGPIGKVRDGDILDIVIDRRDLTAQLNLVASGGRDLADDEARQLLADRPVHPQLRAHADLPGDTRLWAALQSASGGPWAGCVYDADRIIEVINAGLSALQRK
jgi:dihydroxyacid dehydratase/phosphogluconate dehydratase